MKRRTKRIFWKWFWRAMIILIACLLVAIAGNQQSIMVNQEEIKMMQTDTLDQLMELRQIEEETTLGDLLGPESPIAYWLSPEEFDLVCRVVAAESRGESLQGQMAVANVILDRAVLWDMPVVDVVLAPGQFAKPYQGEISDETRLAVANVFEGGVRVFEEPVTHFYSGAEPYWADEKIDRGGIGCHRFLY